MATVSIASPAGDRNPQVNMVELSAAAILGAAKVLDKESRRDDLCDGGNYKVEIHLAARVNNGPVFVQDYIADVSVGHESTRAASTAAPAGDVLALILGKLNAATREAILRELPEEFAANGGKLPQVDESIAEAAESMLKKMRATKSSTVRGAVSVKHQAAQAPLKLFG